MRRPSTMAFDVGHTESLTPDRFVVEVFSEVGEETIQRRWREINTILRLSMLTGLPMQMEAALSMLCDFAAEIANYDAALVYFWEETSEQMLLRTTRGVENISESAARGNILNFWVNKFGRPLLVSKGIHPQADAVLDETNSNSALIVPLVVSNRTLGSMQFFSRTPGAFTEEDAQLLWILALVSENILSREHANEGLLTFAFTDYLTGLKTRGYLEQQLELEIKRCERKKAPLSLLMLDIDFFKPLNDRYGHHVGDQVLRDVSSLLTKDMREVDTVARYGGEEFVIILPETPAASAARVAQRIRKSIERSKFFAGSASSVEKLTISIGIAVYPQDARFKRDLIECADAALYEAKSRGRNQVMMYSEMKHHQREVS
ncbi:MAG TPA: sensor domain-containing diguanylate cyclase [Terriglobales bacterium]|nr:sensor domain-containing diguanylate cyclase [Terriglobales bacterium]